MSPSHSPNYAEYKFNATRNIIILFIIIHSHKMSVKNIRWPQWLILFKFFRRHYQDLCIISTILICISWILSLNFTKYCFIILTHPIQKIEYPIANFFHLKSEKDRGGGNKLNNIAYNFMFMFIGTFLCLIFIFSILIGFKNSLQKFSSFVYCITIILPVLFQTLKIILDEILFGSHFYLIVR